MKPTVKEPPVFLFFFPLHCTPFCLSHNFILTKSPSDGVAFYFTTGWDWAHTGIVSIVRDVSLLYTEGSPQTTLEKWRYNWTQGETSYTVPVHFQFFHYPVRKWFRRSSVIRTGGVLLGWKILCQAGVRTTERLLESWPSRLQSYHSGFIPRMERHSALMVCGRLCKNISFLVIYIIRHMISAALLNLVQTSTWLKNELIINYNFSSGQTALPVFTVSTQKWSFWE